MMLHPRPPRTDQAERRAFDRNLVAVILIAAVLCFPYVIGSTESRSTLISLLTTGLMSLALIWRRARPSWMLALVTLGGIIQLVSLSIPTTAVIVVPIASYSFARWTAGRRARLVLPLGAAAAILGPASWFGDVFNEATRKDALDTIIFSAVLILVCGGLVVTPYAIGRRIRDAQAVTDERRRSDMQQYESALAEREAMGRMVEAHTRAQIARELHDIVAHSLSVMIVQAEGGKALATKKPEKAADVLETIADTGRDALVEMRRIVGVLRGSDDQEAEYRPTPGLPDIADMVQRAGDRVALEQTGTMPPVPPALGLTIYRVAQEGVTNVLKHAGSDAHAIVRMDYRPTLILVEVDDDGVGSASVSDGRGHGLRGMQERVASMGGRLLTRPKATGGYLVRAMFPMPGQNLGSATPENTAPAGQSAPGRPTLEGRDELQPAAASTGAGPSGDPTPDSRRNS